VRHDLRHSVRQRRGFGRLVAARLGRAGSLIGPLLLAEVR
jgi:hypothetical protein